MPDHGDTEVDPHLREIRIRFDQDMTQPDRSICGGGPTFPKTTGQGRWLTKRVFIVPVKLEPNHEYELSVNCASARNFRSASGEEAEIYPIRFRTGSGREPKRRKLSRRANREAIEQLRKAIDERYSYRDLRNVNWLRLFGEYEAKLEKAGTPQAFAREAARMLAEARDPHIWLQVGDTRFASFSASPKPNWNLATLEKLVPGFSKQTDWLYTGRFPDGVGYILMTSWAHNSPQDGAALEAALQSLSDARAMIVDVRPNGGGDESLARHFASHFVDKQAVYSRHVNRDEKQKGGFTRPILRLIAPNASGPKFRVKTATLMGPANMSSCESFLLMMARSSRCRLIGGRSYGSSGNPRPHNLKNGVTVYLPSWKDMKPDGKLLEGQGIAPDIEVKTTPQDFDQRDPVLEAARAWLAEPAPSSGG